MYHVQVCARCIRGNGGHAVWVGAGGSCAALGGVANFRKRVRLERAFGRGGNKSAAHDREKLRVMVPGRGAEHGGPFSECKRSGCLPWGSTAFGQENKRNRGRRVPRFHSWGTKAVTKGRGKHACQTTRQPRAGALFLDARCMYESSFTTSKGPGPPMEQGSAQLVHGMHAINNIHPAGASPVSPSRSWTHRRRAWSPSRSSASTRNGDGDPQKGHAVQQRHACT
jgi:hypothetical protein